MKEVIIKLTSDHIKVKGGEYVRDYQRGEWILLEPRYPIEQKVYWNKEQALADTKGNGARERRKCSCCGYTKSFMCHMKDEQIKLWNFCPNCGADMRERKDFQVIVNGNCTKCGKPLSGNRIFICEECEEQSKESE